MSDSWPGPEAEPAGRRAEDRARQADDEAIPQADDEAMTQVPSYEPAAPAPLGVSRTPTGDAGVDAQLERLADADHLPADGHIEVYEDVHRGLRDALTALDARPGPPAPPGASSGPSVHDNRS
ncbi:hypothetical protein [Streptomyces sp. SYSU K217416]